MRLCVCVCVCVCLFVYDTYACDVLLIGVVEAVHFLLEGLQDLAMSRHVRGQDQGDDGLGGGATGQTSVRHHVSVRET